ncbi:hypothetical protein CEXT_517081 [Caerostris extrusa]|uniref:Ribosomal protein S10 n=1 Tax=Caerostris extrusa TaxID=172846 RepID=A0AAV4XE30_CAEEX|nr:hypothetical protein CEXT_517081 [Caerostris extrusa]
MHTFSIKSFSEICPECPWSRKLFPNIAAFVFTRKPNTPQKLKTRTTTRALKYFKSVPPSLPPLTILFNNDSLQEEFYYASFPLGAPELFKELISRGELPRATFEFTRKPNTPQKLKTWTTTRALKHFKRLPLLPPAAILFNDDSLQEEFYNELISTRGSRAS